MSPRIDMYTFPSALEDEAIYILRETLAQFQRPLLLFSCGKDSICLVHLARKAFYPAPIPFPLLHIDTGHNFPEVNAFRDQFVAEMQTILLIQKVEDSILTHNLIEEQGKYASRNALQSITLLEAVQAFQADACIGGARRDEEKSRAKERIFSFRNVEGKWDAYHQRPELFDILNGKLHAGENMRVFPLSNWTEMDVWHYIQRENIQLPSIYFAHERNIFLRDGLIWAAEEVVYREADELVFPAKVRFRTVGDITCTAGIFSEANTVEAIIQELQASTTSERGARIDDKRSSAAMEDRKKKGYF